MAFVFEAERKINEPGKLQNLVGPGHYDMQQKLTQKQSAPFRSSCVRRSLFEQKQKPGPGDYNVSRPIVEPDIVSVMNKNSIILKINSTGTAQFKSTHERFPEHITDVPGPGQYHDDQKRAMSNNLIQKKKNRFITDKRLREVSKTMYVKHYPTIPQRTRGLTDTKVEQAPHKNVGPGWYNPNRNAHVNSTGAVWGKDITKRFVSQNTNALGPGQYNSQKAHPEQSNSASAGYFKSQTIRTYFDSLLYKTNIAATAEDRAKKHFKAKEPAPGQYNTNFSSFQVKDKPFSYQFFGSTVERFNDEKQRVHHSFYDIKSSIGGNQSFNRGGRAFNSDVVRQPTFLLVQQDQVPGPGQYQEKVVVQKKLKPVKVQMFGSTTDRPLHKADKISDVGPGKYSKEQNVEDYVKTRFGQIKDASFSFKSTTERKCFGNQQSGDHIGEYDLSQHDVATKLQKQKVFLQNLKKIDVQKPGFDVSISRFPHYEDKVSPLKERDAKINLNKQQQIRIKQQIQQARTVVLDSNRNQVHEQREQKGIFAKEERFKNQMKGAPGVGAYSMRSSWERKSHNIKFQRQRK